MTTVQIIIATMLGTMLGVGVVYGVVRAVSGIRQAFQTGLKALRDVSQSASEAAAAVRMVQGELAFMRNAAQGQAPQQYQPEPIPPVGRSGKMPPAFPQWSGDYHPGIPEAEMDDTDRSLLEQTPEDVAVAQRREELREHGVELDIGDDQPAVREEA